MVGALLGDSGPRCAEGDAAPARGGAQCAGRVRGGRLVPVWALDEMRWAGVG